MNNFGSVINSAGYAWTTVKKLISPFIIGFFIAYLFNPFVKLFENILSKAKYLNNATQAKRNLAIALVYILVIGCILWVTKFFVPEITSSLTRLINILPQNLDSFDELLEAYFSEITFIDPKQIVDVLESLFEPILKMTEDIPAVVQTILSSTYNAATGTINIITGIFISFYMLACKDDFKKSAVKIAYAFFEEKTAESFLKKSSLVNSIFSNFIIGKTIDSLIIGILCFLGLTIIKAPFITLISVIVGVTNMIPYFGPFIGGIPSVIIVLMVSPSKALWVGIFILVLQQFDGNFLGPKILSSSTGMNPLWVIFSILIGGAVAGPLGMFIGVPICASIKIFFMEKVDEKYAEKYHYDPSQAVPSEKEET